MKKESIPKGASRRMGTGLQTAEKQSTSSGTNKPMGKNDIYLQILNVYELKDNGVDLFLSSKHKV